jgi:hypothetical protein
MALLLLNVGPNHVGGFMNPTDGLKITNLGRGSAHQEVEMRQLDFDDHNNKGRLKDNAPTRMTHR